VACFIIVLNSFLFDVTVNVDFNKNWLEIASMLAFLVLVTMIFGKMLIVLEHFSQMFLN
jgi:hypothetical protein